MEKLSPWELEDKENVRKVYLRLNQDGVTNVVGDDENYDHTWSYMGFCKLDNHAYLSPKNPDDYEAFPIYSKEELKLGQTLYVLWVEYSSGDSFGHGTGYGEIIAVYADLELANQALKNWSSKTSDSSSEKDYTYTVETTFSEDIILNISNPGSGYFEDLTDVHLEFVQILG